MMPVHRPRAHAQGCGAAWLATWRLGRACRACRYGLAVPWPGGRPGITTTWRTAHYTGALPGNPRAAYAGPGSISGFLYGTFTTACIKVCVQVAGKPPLMGFIRIGALSRMCGIGPAGCSIAAAVPPIMRRVPCLEYYGPTWGRELGRTAPPGGVQWGDLPHLGRSKHETGT